MEGVCMVKILPCPHLRPLYCLGHHYTKWGHPSYITTLDIFCPIEYVLQALWSWLNHTCETIARST
jgi:hypothetical protein